MTMDAKNVPHDSARGHVTGRSIFIDDIPPMAGELVVGFLWSPHAHARIRSIDLTAARAVPGVAGLFTHADLATNRFGAIIADEPLLAESEVTFIGQPIVVIAAETRLAMEAATRAITIDFEVLPPILTIEAAVAANEFIGVPREIRRGDPEDALANAPHVIEGTFECGAQDQFYLESQAAIAWPGEDAAINIHSSTQNPTEGQEVIAHLLGLRQSDVVVMNKRMGGAFGGKECQATHPAAMAALVAQKLRRPARIVYDKDTDMVVTGHRHPFRNRYRIGFDDEGRIVAGMFELFADGGAYADLSPAIMARAMCHIDNAYYLPHVAILGRVCRTNSAPNTAFRGFGGPQGAATVECALQEIAAKLGRDAYDVRRVNCYGVGERNVTPYGQTVEHNQLPAMFDRLCETSDYRARLAEVQRINATSETTLAGIAMTAVKFGISFNTTFLNQANALVNVYLDGSVQVSTGATEMGQGVNTKIAMVVAEELGVRLEDVRVMITSTEKNNNTSATAASSASDLNGSAAVIAAKKIRERMAPVAAELLAKCAPKPKLGSETLEADRRTFTASGAGAPDAADLEVRPPREVVFRDSRVFFADAPDHAVTFKDVCVACHHARVSLGERGFYATPEIHWDAEKFTGRPFLYFTNATAVSEVRVDRFTGTMKLVRTDILMDIGKSINEAIDRGQITGAFAQGLGWCTTEEMRYAADGTLLTHSPTTYKIPNIGDLPQAFHVELFPNETNTINLRGSKAVGEPPLLTAISVWCAIKHALGFLAENRNAPLRMPATPEEIVMRIDRLERAAMEAPAGVV